MTEKKSGVRQANFELLRIVATLMVLILHALNHGGVLEQYAFNTMPYTLFWFLDGLCYIAVDVFVLITGYFMVNASFKLSRIIKLFLQVEAFSIFCLGISMLVFKTDMSLNVLRSFFFPLTSSSYWFASHYMVLLALMPLLNRFIRALDLQAYRTSLILLIIVFSVIPSIAYWSRDDLFSGFSFVWFIVLYLTSGYIRLYWSEPSKYKMTSIRWFGLYLGFVAVLGVSRSVIGTIGMYFYGEPKRAGIFRSYNSVVIFAAALCFFMAFKEMKIKCSADSTEPHGRILFWRISGHGS